VRGSPIRTPSDQRSVGSSPRLIAASHVLHRLLMPRHPPCALNNLTNTQKQTLDKNRPERPKAFEPEKMLASTVQFSTNKQPPAPTPPPDPGNTRAVRQTNRPCREEAPAPTRGRGPLPQDPTACLRPRTRPRPASTHPGGRSTRGRQIKPAAELVSVPPSSTTQTPRGPPLMTGHLRSGMALHRPGDPGR
jgi:hypothetical protein